MTKSSRSLRWATSSQSSGDSDPKEIFGMTTLGSKAFEESFEFNSMTYTEEVKLTFKHSPGVYREFKQILSEVTKPTSNKLELIKRIIMLFDGYPHLIKGFTYFLPPEISVEVQQDAVVLNVEDEPESDEEAKPLADDTEDDTDTMRYIRNVKWTYMHQPKVYEKFSRILQDFNRKSVQEAETVAKIAILFEGQPDLVLGFNTFLSGEYRILEHTKHGYVLRHPCKKGLKPHYTPVNVKEVYLG